MKLNETQENIVVLTSKNLRERVASVVFRLINVFNFKNNCLIQSTLTRKEIGSIIGASTEAVIQIFN